MKTVYFVAFFITFPLSAQVLTPPTNLFSSVTLGNREKIKKYVEAGADINKRNEDGKTALHLAYEFRSLHIMPFARSSRNRIEFEPDTSDIIDYLLEQGADPDIKDHYGRVPSDYLEKKLHEGKTIHPGYKTKNHTESDRHLPQPLLYLRDSIKNWCGGLFK